MITPGFSACTDLRHGIVGPGIFLPQSDPAGTHGAWQSTPALLRPAADSASPRATRRPNGTDGPAARPTKSWSVAPRRHTASLRRILTMLIDAFSLEPHPEVVSVLPSYA